MFYALDVADLRILCAEVIPLDNETFLKFIFHFEIIARSISSIWNTKSLHFFCGNLKNFKIFCPRVPPPLGHPNFPEHFEWEDVEKPGAQKKIFQKKISKPFRRGFTLIFDADFGFRTQNTSRVFYGRVHQGVPNIIHPPQTKDLGARLGRQHGIAVEGMHTGQFVYCGSKGKFSLLF